ncbi:right-handed parallel beta-helix repeat-containing protein [Acinetobacter baumannii]|uniref:right-handed parallel beta-helix repeat-containing protein n=1 Tax=Acinetobacter baumannii TaxID=470 RepID=UPI00234112B6|nr:right-handed parallel beta-helix repeat-containing protein [Acinetobacter baumannii]MDC4584377.1 right-handed parallel beta-helix repeat-containing protein [Acinetobacter baumannii]MDH2629417.1 right-handed parallel beta-helix repeat-containing protein [Acinetobacter baumannii]HDU8210431.1 right-handed parallel beta-helix repeat-containing protein [Acinetobacter baumannii]
MNLAPYTSFPCLIIISSIAFANSNLFQDNMDITDLVNNKIKENSLIKIPAGNFKINAEKSIILKNNVTIEMSPKTVLNVIPNEAKSYQVFKIHNVNNVRISGGTIIGDKYTHRGTKGEWGTGIEIKDSQNIYLSNIIIKKMWGDAIYIGNNGKNSNSNLNLINLKLDDNRRQGISVVSVNGLFANNIIISNTRGKSPMSGIDIEPNNNRNILKNIKFSQISTVNNAGDGFQISLKKYNNSMQGVSISLSEYNDYGSRSGIRIQGLKTPVIGEININKVNLKNNKISNYCFKDWENNKVKIKITNLLHDKEYIKNQDKWCSPYTNNDFLKVVKRDN